MTNQTPETCTCHCHIHLRGEWSCRCIKDCEHCQPENFKKEEAWETQLERDFDYVDYLDDLKAFIRTELSKAHAEGERQGRSDLCRMILERLRSDLITNENCSKTYYHAFCKAKDHVVQARRILAEEETL